MNNIKVSNQSGLTGVLAGSLKALKQNPVLFAPKLASTFIGAVWFVVLLELIKGSEVSLTIIPIFLVSTVVLLFIGLLSSVIVSAMVDMDDLYSGLELLKQGTISSKENLVDIGLTVASILLVIILSYIVIAAGLMGYWVTGNILILALVALLSLVAVIAMSFYLYFIPVSLLKKQSFTAALKDSKGFSSENSRDVTLLLIFSLLVLSPALYFTGSVEALGYAGFVISRMVSGVVNTYVFTLSPEYYLSSQGLD